MDRARFIADGMLGTLARKLRIFGYDVIYDTDLDDRELTDLAKATGRIMLTADAELYEICTRQNLKGVKLGLGNDLTDMATIFRQLGLTPDDILIEESRCPQCNGELHKTDPEEIMRQIPKKVAETHSEIKVCVSCGKTYWKGRHWRMLQEFTDNLRAELTNEKAGEIKMP